MSTISIDRLPPETRDHPPLVTTIDDRRGTGGMWLFILTEAALFLMLFFAYFYLAQGGWRWPFEKPPKLHFAIPMLVVLWTSSGVLHGRASRSSCWTYVSRHAETCTDWNSGGRRRSAHRMQ